MKNKSRGTSFLSPFMRIVSSLCSWRSYSAEVPGRRYCLFRADTRPYQAQPPDFMLMEGSMECKDFKAHLTVLALNPGPLAHRQRMAFTSRTHFHKCLCAFAMCFVFFLSSQETYRNVSEAYIPEGKTLYVICYRRNHPFIHIDT